MSSADNTTTTTLQIVGTGKGSQGHYAMSDSDTTYCGKANISWRRAQDDASPYYRSATCFRCLKHDIH